MSDMVSWLVVEKKDSLWQKNTLDNVNFFPSYSLFFIHVVKKIAVSFQSLLSPPQLRTQPPAVRVYHLHSLLHFHIWVKLCNAILWG